MMHGKRHILSFSSTGMCGYIGVNWGATGESLASITHVARRAACQALRSFSQRGFGGCHRVVASHEMLGCLTGHMSRVPKKRN
jgi:hypothetical protein